MKNSLYASASIDILTVEQKLLGREWRSKHHRDDVSRLYFISSGEAFLKHSSLQYHLRPGYLYLVPADSIMVFHCPEQFYQHFVHFRIRVCGGLDLFRLLECDYEIVCPDPSKTLALLNKLESVHLQDGPVASVMSIGLLLELISPFLSSAKSIAPMEKGLIRLQPVIDHIEANLHNPPNLSALSDLVHLESAYFSRFFKQHLKTSPISYILQRRVERAKTLLLRSDHSIKEVAQKLGFFDEFHFSRTFKRLTGQSPREFQNTPRIP